MAASLLSRITGWLSPPAPPVTPGPAPERGLPPELLKQIRSIQIKTSHLVTEAMAGEYQSAFKGRGMEFAEVREYQPGDDVRLIDWNVTARMSHPFIKEFREERELTVLLLVDASASGQFGSVGKMKNEITAELASLLAYSAIRNNDKIGLIVFSDHIEHFIPPKKGRAHVWNIIRTILTFSPRGRKTDLNVALRYLLNIQKRKAVTFLISDFQAPDFTASLKLARQKHDLIAVRVGDPREEAIPDVGLICLEDVETGEQILFDSQNPETRNRFAALRARERESFRKLMQSLGVDHIEIQTHRSLTEPLLRYFKLREKKH
ncbi:MAG: DUF58 domain-containing protein [Nitrospinae bacterium CG11_big_fil_rev_8_21_14_0_20_56_8]|nr:MAG: DUF58 domain-containing protein [Nitrospinae bacterium CG11_big_fil_rev_8_21_14_0_20_56_8]